VSRDRTGGESNSDSPGDSSTAMRFGKCQLKIIIPFSGSKLRIRGAGMEISEFPKLVSS
jgi:hypothetical protein